MRPVPIAHPWIDGSHAPIYEIRFPVGASDDDVRGFASSREEWMKRARHPVSWVVDLTHLKTVSAAQRRLFAEHLTRFERHDVTYNRGSALVLPSAFLRGVATAVFWVSPPKFPHRAFETVSEAREWAKQQLEGTPARPAPTTA